MFFKRNTDGRGRPISLCRSVGRVDTDLDGAPEKAMAVYRPRKVGWDIVSKAALIMDDWSYSQLASTSSYQRRKRVGKLVSTWIPYEKVFRRVRSGTTKSSFFTPRIERTLGSKSIFELH